MGTQAAGECFHSCFRVLPNFHEHFYNWIETWRKSFLCLLEDTATKKVKQLVYFDDQNVDSLCLHHHYINSFSCASSVFPSSFSINLLAFYHECCSLIGYATHYLLGDR